MDEQTQSLDQELDLGIAAPTPDEIDYEAAYSKTKPDFQRIAKALGIKGEGSTQEEVEQSLLAKQKLFEEDLKTNLVPKVQAALQAGIAKVSGNKAPATKPGVTVSTSNTTEPRKTKAWQGYS
jgi:hypothetical protein